MGMEHVARVLNVDPLRIAESEGALVFGVTMAINASRRHARKDRAQSRLPVLNRLISL
jgi:hypothetical protein